jgi:hypothetical protein
MAAMEHEAARPHAKQSSFVSLLSGWAQQGVQTFFTTQRILLDLAMRQNANVMHAVRQQLTDPDHSPTAILSDLAGEGVTNFMEAQKVLLNLGRQQNEILLAGVKERVGDWPAAQAVTDLLQKSLDAFITMQQELLKIAGKQTDTWVEATRNGKVYPGEHLMELAREGMENFVKAQKQFLDVVAEETAKATSGKHTNATAKKVKKTELAELARQASEAFIEAQKKLADVTGQQLSFNLKAAGKAVELLRPFPFLQLGELTREGVKSYVDAQKALMDVFVKTAHAPKHAQHHAKRPSRPVKKHSVAAAAAV